MLGLKGHEDTLLLQDQSKDVRRRLEAMRLQATAHVPEQDKREAKMREASQDFEALLLHQLLKQMRSTVPKEGLLHSRDKEFWQSHFDTEMSVLWARAGGIGLGEIIFQQLREHQIKASKASSPPAKDIPVMTLLPPYIASTAEEKTPDKTEQASAPLVVSDDEHEPDLPHAHVESVYSARLLGISDPMERVRSLARAIEERGGVVPEHPGFAPDEKKTPDKTEQASAPLVVSDDEHEPDLPHAHVESVYSARLLGISDPMERVRSLARAIEERGGVVPEHPGFAPDEINVARDVTAAAGLPPMHWPLQARVSSGFGWRRDPFTGERAWHAGVDLAAPKGTPVQAAWDGRVVFVGEQGGFGRIVVLEHAGGWRTYYAHNDANKVRVGDKVRAGQTIATVGLSGRSSGPHLHFEIRQDNLAWDPKQVRDRLLAGLPIGREDSA